MSIKISPAAVVCNECELVGDITIGNKTVIHPRARIVAEGGPIIIGESNLIEEQVQIIYRSTDGKSNIPMLIGNYNVFEVGARILEHGQVSYFFTLTVTSFPYAELLLPLLTFTTLDSESPVIGDNNVLEAKSKLGKETQLTNGCIVGAMCELTSPEIIPENTVIYGAKCERRVQCERPSPQTLQLDFLTKVLPNYHHLKKMGKPTTSAKQT